MLQSFSKYDFAHDRFELLYFIFCWSLQQLIISTVVIQSFLIRYCEEVCVRVMTYFRLEAPHEVNLYHRKRTRWARDLMKTILSPASRLFTVSKVTHIDTNVSSGIVVQARVLNYNTLCSSFRARRPTRASVGPRCQCGLWTWL